MKINLNLIFTFFTSKPFKAKIWLGSTIFQLNMQPDDKGRYNRDKAKPKILHLTVSELSCGLYSI